MTDIDRHFLPRDAAARQKYPGADGRTAVKSCGYARDGKDYAGVNLMNMTGLSPKQLEHVRALVDDLRETKPQRASRMFGNGSGLNCAIRKLIIIEIESSFYRHEKEGNI